MSDVTGSCICRGIKLTIPASATPQKAMACWCIQCQKNGGAPLQTNAAFKASDVTVHDPEGLLQKYEITGTASGLPKEKNFCGRCGVGLFSKPGRFKGEMLVIKTGILDAERPTEVYPPTTELYVKDRPSYMKPVEGAVQYETMPD